ncbi:DUF4406 domain-containing protein [Vibrio parahaemolyticus]|uniref:DUF4406 domain-containing protein n=1 Tax=Vibrio parahaemolyticus TaxID=670 RepID=UPI00067D9F4F|nr:DUF4406 domain-containing protein [Vibrio parahaemolyticus]
MAKKFYIAGPVSKETSGNYAAFKQVADQITESGHIALYTSLLPQGMSEEEYMKFAHAMLEVCDVVVLLHRWSMSDGAVAEFHWAVKLGKNIIREEHLPLVFQHHNVDSVLCAATNEVVEMVSFGSRSI